MKEYIFYKILTESDDSLIIKQRIKEVLGIDCGVEVEKISADTLHKITIQTETELTDTQKNDIYNLIK
jgi:hypothetical protein